jgi:hypothetical protein
MGHEFGFGFGVAYIVILKTTYINCNRYFPNQTVMMGELKTELSYAGSTNLKSCGALAANSS